MENQTEHPQQNLRGQRSTGARPAQTSDDREEYWSRQNTRPSKQMVSTHVNKALDRAAQSFTEQPSQIRPEAGEINARCTKKDALRSITFNFFYKTWNNQISLKS
ncbi:hypothetical protein ILYODFUR_036947 [Ilyodon furcidens]|uniref:Uncharacterized protein n=1 Tax=Ilyodon furcidens TaxID=33524 RepID=A0ABV0VLQ5_9TELE